MSERMKELKAFDDTKLGVKGLVDSGIVNIPKIFVRPADKFGHLKNPHEGIPLIDLDRLLATKDGHGEIVDEVRIAAEKWGFFQVVNHGVPCGVLDNMLSGIRKFNEEDFEAKKEFYGRDRTRRVNFYSNYDLFQSQTVGWRDSLVVSMLTSDNVDPNELPLACRDATIEFINHIREFGDKVFDLLSESLGLKPEYLRSMQCNEGKLLSCNYYPKCPNPELAIGITEHSDTSFLTILAQDQIGGLQVLNQDQCWVDVEPIPGALVVNIGDFLQLVSNDKFKSSVHRVVPSREARASAALFLSGRFAPPVGLYGPIKELISEENPPKYRQVLVTEHVANFYSKGLHEKPGLNDYRLL